MQTLTIEVKNAHAARLIDELAAMKVIRVITTERKKSMSKQTGKRTEKPKHPVLKSIEQGLKEVELIKKGKLKATPLKEFLDEI